MTKQVAKKPSSKKRAVKAKSAAVKTKRKASTHAKNGKAAFSLAQINYKNIESELLKLTEMVTEMGKKNKLVAKSLNYIEKERKVLAKQMREPMKYISQLRNKGMKALKDIPDNAEGVYSNIKKELNKISHRLGL